jgi:hypothetical protein
MSIEVSPGILHLDALKPQVVKKQIAQLEKKKASLLTLGTSARDWDQVRDTLCSARASGLSVLLLLEQVDSTRPVHEVLVLLASLRDWDQLLLRNFLEVCSARVPEKYLPALQHEAKIELKWFQEWQTALSDPRIHRYPGLPWRSFLRKVNAENYAFAKALLESTTEDARLLEGFLMSKKKTICVFPKNWSRK